MTAADRPSVTDNARAEAERHWPRLYGPEETLTYPREAVREHTRGGFVAGYEAGWAAGRAETTTATTEDAVERVFQTTHPAPNTVMGWIRAGYEAGLLATARTVNVHPTYTVEYQQKIADELDVEREAVLRALGLAAPLLATARTRPTCGATTNDAGPCVLDPDHITVSAHTGPSGWSWNDDVTMARFGDDDEEADRG